MYCCIFGCKMPYFVEKVYKFLLHCVLCSNNLALKLFFSLGRKAVLTMIKKSKYGEVLKEQLEERRTNAQVKFQMKYHIHDIVGAELVQR